MYERLNWSSDFGLFTRKGVEWLHSQKIDSAESYLRIIELLDEEIKLLSKELEGIAKDDEAVKLLMTIPGIGYCTSGNTVGHRGVTKEGNRWLRWVMIEAAQTHVHKYDTSIT
jgi:transposase